jgi:hypothetical protein
MLGYLLEYYSENSLTHISWMINVIKILPRLSGLSNHDYYGTIYNNIFLIQLLYLFIKSIFIYIGNYLDLLLYKPCFGKMKYNFPIKSFRALSVCKETLKVCVPLTNLISTNSDPFLYNKIRYIFSYLI